MSGSKKPCPGCHQVVIGRPAAEICWKCRRALDETLPALQTAIDGRRSTRQPYRWSTTHHWNPTIHTAGRGSYDERTEVQKALCQIIELLGERPVPGQSFHEVPRLLEHIRRDQYQGAFSEPERTILMHPEDQIAILRLWQAIEAASEATYESGQEDGRWFLQKLIGGELSPAEVNEAATK